MLKEKFSAHATKAQSLPPLSTRKKRALNLKHTPFYPGKDLPVPTKRSLGGPRIWYGSLGYEKYLTTAGMRNQDRPARSLLTKLTTLSRLLAITMVV
jgi:type 1 glutamine amidotransferase